MPNDEEIAKLKDERVAINSRDLFFPPYQGRMPKRMTLEEHEDKYVILLNGVPYRQVERVNGFTIPEEVATLMGYVECLENAGLQMTEIKELDSIAGGEK